MADITITAANVALADGATVELEVILAGATIARGQPYYRDTTDSNKAKLAYANDSAASQVRGIALTGGASGTYIVGIRSGNYTIGATVSAAVEYYLSRTAGGICPQADLTTGDRVVQLFRAKTTTIGIVNIDISGITV